MTLKQIRLVTNDVAKLTRFYESVSQAKAEILSGGYVQFHNEPCDGLAIVEQASTEAYGAGVAEAVTDIDAEYERLQDIVSDWVMAPKLMPWGARAIVFRDPDGNLVNIYAHP